MLDFEKEFSDFVNAGDSSAIKDIYNIIPTLSNSQIKIITSLNFYIRKYDLIELKEVIEEYLKMIAKNKNLGYLQNMNLKNLLKAYTQEELVKGIKVNAQSNSREE